MCYVCWSQAGSPRIVNSKTIHLADLIFKAVEENICVPIFSHYDADDSSIRDSISNLNRFDQEVSRSQLDCLNEMLKCSMDERISALAIHDGIIPLKDYYLQSMRF